MQTKNKETGPLIITISISVALLMSGWVIASTRKAHTLEKTLKKTLDENEILSKAVTKMTEERDQLAKDKEDLTKQLAMREDTLKATSEMLYGFGPGSGTGGEGSGQYPIQITSPTGGRITISDGGMGPAFPMMGGMGMPPQGAMNPAQVMSQMAAITSELQKENMRKIQQAEQEMRGEITPKDENKEIEKTPKGRKKERQPQPEEAYEKKSLEYFIGEHVNMLAFQLNLSENQKTQVYEALKDVYIDLFPYEQEMPGKSEAAGASGGEKESGKQLLTADFQKSYRKNSDEFAVKMREILTDEQYQTFEIWKKKQDQAFDAWAETTARQEQAATK